MNVGLKFGADASCNPRHATLTAAYDSKNKHEQQKEVEMED